MRHRRLGVLFASAGLLAGIVLCGCKKSSNSGDNSSPVNVEAAKKKSVENLIELGMAFHNYASANGGDKLPSPGSPNSVKSKDGVTPLPYSWRFMLLPYIEKAEIYEQADLFKKSVDNKKDGFIDWGPLPDSIRNAHVATYQNPLVQGESAKTNYRVFVGNGAAFEWDKNQFFGRVSFPDDIGNTIFVVESAEAVDWASVDELEYDPTKPLPKLGIFEGGFHALMGDGVVRWIPADTDEKLIRAMITRNGGEKIKLPGKPLNGPGDKN